MNERLLNLFEKPFGDVLSNLFADMALLEEWLVEAMADYPAQAQRIDALFAITVRPPGIPSTAPTALYRHHFDQLVSQVVEGMSFTPTTVDVVGAIAKVSEAQPVRPDFIRWLNRDETLREIFGWDMSVGTLSEARTREIEDEIDQAFSKWMIEREQTYAEALRRRERLPGMEDTCSHCMIS